MTFQTEEKAKVRRQRAEQAIKLALESRWEDAVAANRAMLESFKDDVEALNRLGKALFELGRYKDARDAYTKARQVDSTNTIAKRNLERLATLIKEPAPKAAPQRRLDPELFIEEIGKTGVTLLQRVNGEALARMTPGDQVQLKVNGNKLAAETMAGARLGDVEPRLGLRLAKLMKGGNKYVAGITSIDNSGCRIIIREVHQDPSQAGRLSFPAAGIEAIRPYTKESLVRYETEDEEETEEPEAAEEWEAEPEPDREGRSGDMNLEDYQRVAEKDDTDEEFEE